MNCKKNAKSRSDDEYRLFDPAVEKVVEIGLERLRPFENHPFKVKEDEAMARLMESIERYGIMNPLIVMPTSVTYKLKLNGGDIKAVQGDSGHSQINMVTDVYSHIIDDDRRKNAELFEEAFYEKKDLDPSMHAHAVGKTVELPTDVDAELLAKVLSNPEMAALLSTLAKSLEKK